MPTRHPPLLCEKAHASEPRGEAERSHMLNTSRLTCIGMPTCARGVVASLRERTGARLEEGTFLTMAWRARVAICMYAMKVAGRVHRCVLCTPDSYKCVYTVVVCTV